MFKNLQKKLICIILTSIILICFSMLLSNNSYAKETRKWEDNYSEETIIVKYKENTLRTIQWFINTSINMEEEGSIGPDRNNVKVLKVRRGQTVEESLEKYLDNSNVEYAEPNYICNFDLVPNDPNWNTQVRLYDIDMLNITKAWDYTIGSDDMITAVIDSGCRYNHADLQEKIIVGWDFGEGGSNGQPLGPVDISTYGHGTGVCGVIGANTNNRNRNSRYYMER